MTKTKVEPRQIYDVDFEGQVIETVMGDDGERYVVVRRICCNLGIDFSRQQKRLQNDPDFSCGIMSVTALDGKNYSMVCLPLSQYQAWLFMINPNKVKTEIRPLLSAYRKRSIQVLNDFWTTGIAIATQDDCKLINELHEAIATKDTKISELESDKKNLVVLVSKKNNYITKLTDEKAEIVASTFTLNNTIESQRQQIQQFTDKINAIYNEGNMLLAAKDSIIRYQSDIIKQYQIITGSGFNI